MNKEYNFYNLEAPFKLFLNSGNKKISPISINNYLSDLRHFFGWIVLTIKNRKVPIQFASDDYQQILSQFLTAEIVQSYTDYLGANNIPMRTINRRLSTLRKFCSFCISQGWLRTNPAKQISNIQTQESKIKRQQKISLLDEDREASESPITSFATPPSVKKGWLNGILGKQVLERVEDDKSVGNDEVRTRLRLPANLGIQHYVGIALVLVLMATLGAGVFNQFFNKAKTPFAFPSQLTKPSQRYVSFQGRVTDSLGNPIVTATNFQFKLYNVKTAGTSLYATGTCSLTPDQDGILNVLVGGSGLTTDQNVCGTGITENIFSDFPNVYLGITIGADSEATPRQHIATVGYAVNSETLQGFPPGKDKSTIPYLDLNGDVLIATSGASIKSLYESANFTLASSKDLILQSAGPAAGAGDIILQATGSGALRFRTAGSADAQTRMIVDNAGLVGIGTTTPTSKLHVTGAVTGKALSIFDETGDQSPLTASESGKPVFTVAHPTGTIVNGLTLTPSISGSGVALASTGDDTNIALSIDAKGTGALNLNNTATGDVLIAGGSGATGCTVTNSNGNFACTGTITSGGTAAVLGSGTLNRLAKFTATGSTIGDSSITDTGSAVTLASNVTLATAGSSGTITSAGTLTASNGLTLTTGALNLTSTSGAVALTLSSSTTAFNVQSGVFDIDTTNSRVGIGTTSPLEKLDVNGNATASGNLTLVGAARTIAGRAMNSLTLGDSQTGNILLSPGSNAIVLGTGENGTPVATTLRGTAGAGTNVAGATLTVDASDGTGNAGSGNITFRTAPSRPTITPDGTNDSSGNSGSAGTNTLSFSHTTGSGTDRILVVGVSFKNASSQTVTGITYATKAFTNLTTATNGTTVRTEMWYLVGPPIGTNTITVTTTGGNLRMAAGAASFFGVNQTTPFGTAVTNTGTTTTATVDVTSATDELVIDSVAKDNSTEAITPSGSQVQRWNDTTTSTASNNARAGGSTLTGAATTTMAWTWPTTARAWATIGAPLKPVGSASGSTADTLSDVLFVSSKQLVGIGTTSPLEKLDVAGNILLQGGGYIDTRAAGTLGIGLGQQTALTLGRTGATTTLTGSTVTFSGNVQAFTLAGSITGSGSTPNITGMGNITGTGISGTTITASSTLTASNGLTLTTGALSLTATSGSIALTGFGTTAITSTTATGNIFSLTDTSLTTGTLQSLTATYAPTAGGTQNAVSWAITNSPVTNTNTLRGLNLTFTDGGTLANTVTGLNVDVTTANANDTTYAAVFQGGNVGIGVTTPNKLLDVQGAVEVNLPGTATSFALCHTTQTGTTNEEIVDCTGTPIGDFAESYPTEGSVDYGEIVMVGTKDIVLKDGKHVRELVHTNSPYTKHMIGITSNNYQDFISIGQNVKESDHPMPVALNGRVPVKISSSSPPIKAGDYLTSSYEEGRAMKAEKAGEMIGKALESWDPSSGKDTIMVFVNLRYGDPDVFLTSTEGFQLGKTLMSTAGKMQWQLTNVLGETVKRVGTFSEIASAYIRAGFIQTGELVAGNITSTEKIVSPVIETTDLKASGEAQLNQISTNVIKPTGTDLTVDLGSGRPEQVGNDNSNSGPLAKIIIKGLNGKTVSTIDAAGNASFSGTIAAKDASISGTIAAGKVQTNEASISGTLTAKEIQSDTISELRDRLTLAAADSGQAKTTSQEISTSVNNIQSLLADIRSQPIANPQYYQNLDTNPVVGSLTVSGDATFYNATVANSLNAGTVNIANNQISSLTTELKLTALSSVNILDGAVVIARDGTMTTTGKIIAKGGIEVQNSDLRFKNKEGIETAQIDSSGSAKFKSLSLDKYLDATSSAVITPEENFNRNGLLASAIETQKQTAGIGIVPDNSTEIVIYNETVKNDSLIYLTPTTTTNAQLTVVKKEICPATVSTCKSYFKVTSSQPIHPEIGFNWLIIN